MSVNCPAVALGLVIGVAGIVVFGVVVLGVGDCGVEGLVAVSEEVVGGLPVVDSAGDVGVAVPLTLVGGAGAVLPDPEIEADGLVADELAGVIWVEPLDTDGPAAGVEELVGRSAGDAVLWPAQALSVATARTPTKNWTIRFIISPHLRVRRQA